MGLTPGKSTQKFYGLLCPLTMTGCGGGGGGGAVHIVFSADPVGVASCPHSISLLIGHILAKLIQIYHWEGRKC